MKRFTKEERRYIYMMAARLLNKGESTFIKPAIADTANIRYCEPSAFPEIYLFSNGPESSSWYWSDECGAQILALLFAAEICK